MIVQKKYPRLESNLNGQRHVIEHVNMFNIQRIINLFRSYNIKLIRFSLYFFILASLISSCVPKKSEVLFNDIYCDVDISKLDKSMNRFAFLKNDTTSIYLSSGGFISNKEAYSGSHSILLTGKKNFGFSIKYDSLKGDDHFLISVWRKDPSEKSVLVAQGNKTGVLYIPMKDAVEKGPNGWEKLVIDLEVPPNITDVKFYVWRNGADSAYFDDFKVQHLPPKEYPNFSGMQKLHLYFSEKKMQKFESKRYQAFEDGILISDGEWMKGIISDETNVMPIKSRLKGDWLDHLHGEKWSLRVKMRDDYTFNRMVVFSLQNPYTRYYLNEYVAHQLYAKEDILTTRYGFVPVYLNGKSLGIYAWEEHFAKQLVEFNLRREGPILKFDEDAFWRMQQYFKKNNEWVSLPYYETSRVVAFGMGKILRKPVLKQQFQIAQGLMYQYKDQKAPIDEIFNLEVFAKYWAIGDIINGRHGRAWHNQRMYYNPVLCKLEPINFDDYTEHYDKAPPAEILALSLEQGVIPPENMLFNHLFNSPQFLNLYFAYLEKYSNDSLMRAFMESEKASYSHYESLIQQEFKRYKFDEDFLLKNALAIRDELPALKQKIEDGYFEKQLVSTIEKVADTGFHPVLIPDYVNAYYSLEDDGKAQLHLENYTGRTIEVVGLADEDDRMIHLFQNPVFLNAFVKKSKGVTVMVPYKMNATSLVFKVNDHDDILYSELSLWMKNTGISPYQKILHSSDYTKVGLFEERGDSLIVKAGKYQLSKKVLIPANKILVFEANVELDIINYATIISHAPVFMNGTKSGPILIHSSDTTANAFTVLQAQGESKLNYVVFSHLNTLSYDGWILTGAVNFYESDVEIVSCTFENNHCEDALNIIRSDFLVSESNFYHVFSDAFDSDFCTGVLESSNFQYVGNDAIDFSTSQITIDNCDIKNIGDKGVSGGEGSTLMVLNTEISDCNIGAASKDLSVVEIKSTNIQNCNYGLVALKKKPEYGPAILKTKNLNIQNCQRKYLIEVQSELNFNGRKIEGNREKVAELFY